MYALAVRTQIHTHARTYARTHACQNNRTTNCTCDATRRHGKSITHVHVNVIIFICPVFVVLLFGARNTVQCVCSVHCVVNGHTITRPFNLFTTALESCALVRICQRQENPMKTQKRIRFILIWRNKEMKCDKLCERSAYNHTKSEIDREMTLRTMRAYNNKWATDRSQVRQELVPSAFRRIKWTLHKKRYAQRMSHRRPDELTTEHRHGVRTNTQSSIRVQ